VQRISGAIAAAVLAGIALVAVLVAVAAREPTRAEVALWLGGWLVLVALVGTWSQVWPSVRYRHVSWRADRTGLRIDSGVWWRSTVSVPRSRVQHTDVQQGPIDRGFELAALVVHTAGTQHASITLAGLAHADALTLRDFLIEERPEPGDG